jgi:hypothetical protein
MNHEDSHPPPTLLTWVVPRANSCASLIEDDANLTQLRWWRQNRRRLWTLTDHESQSLRTVHMHGRGLLREWWWPVSPKLVFTRWLYQLRNLWKTVAITPAQTTSYKANAVSRRLIDALIDWPSSAHVIPRHDVQTDGQFMWQALQWKHPNSVLWEWKTHHLPLRVSTQRFSSLRN